MPTTVGRVHSPGGLNVKRGTALIAGMTASVACLFPTPASAVDDGRGRDWRQVVDTRGLSYAAVAAQCANDGATFCVGGVGSVELDDWIWGTEAQVLDLFGTYVPAILAAPDHTVAGFEYAQPAALFASRFALTMNIQGCPTYQPCFDFRQVAGTTATVDPDGAPIGGDVVLSDFTASFAVSAFTPGNPRGFWLWRPTGLLDGSVHAYNDKGRLATPNGGAAIANVLANDYAAGARATLANVALEFVSSTDVGVTLDADGSVDVAPGTAVGTYSLTYRICALANPAACDDARATVVVPSFPIVANADSGRVSFGAGGTAIASVLANDTLGGVRPSPSTVTLSVVSTSSAGISLDLADGSVDVAPGTPSAPQALVYRVCERANPGNCAQATATVAPHSSDAVNDSFRMSSKVASSAPSVLNNDTFNGARATTALVRLSLVGGLPSGVAFSTTTGVLSTKGKVSSGTFLVRYRICEISSPGNCDEATVTLELSGKGA
jgi:hypothetical protein